MKRISVRLSINKPCSENWENMSATDKGAFCKQCQNEVIDFSKLPDNQIVDFFSHHNGMVCGKLKNSQVNRFINSPTPYNYSSPNYYKLFVGLFVSTFLNDTALAKSSIFEAKKPSTFFTEKQLLNTDISEPSNDSLKKFIKGKVLDKETNEPIPFANIFIKAIEIGVSTDLDGCFLLSVPKAVVIDTFAIKVSCLGYGSLEIINCTIQDFGINKTYYLKKDEIMYLGGVNVVYTEPIKKKKWWQRKQK